MSRLKLKYSVEDKIKTVIKEVDNNKVDINLIGFK